MPGYWCGDKKCFLKSCGDGYRDLDLGEECDDKNLKNGDGCTDECKVEPGFTCRRRAENDADACRLFNAAPSERFTDDFDLLKTAVYYSPRSKSLTIGALTTNKGPGSLLGGSSDSKGTGYSICKVDLSQTPFLVDQPSHQAVQVGIKYLAEDDSFEVALPKPFEFFAKTYRTVFIGSNGYLTFGGPDTSLANTLSSHFDQPRVSAFFDDLSPNLDPGSTVYYEFWDCDEAFLNSQPNQAQTAADNCRFVVTYVGVHRFGQIVDKKPGTKGNTFQMALYLETGLVRILWWDIMHPVPLNYGGFVTGISGGRSQAGQLYQEAFTSAAWFRAGYATAATVPGTLLGDAFGANFTVETFYKVDLADRIGDFRSGQQQQPVAIFTTRVIDAQVRKFFFLHLNPDATLTVRVKGELPVGGETKSMDARGTSRYKLPFDRWVHLAVRVERRSFDCTMVTRSCTKVTLYVDKTIQAETELDESWHYETVTTYTGENNTVPVYTTTYLASNFNNGLGLRIGGGDIGLQAEGAYFQAAFFSEFRVYSRLLSLQELGGCSFGGLDVSRDGLVLALGLDQTLSDLIGGTTSVDRFGVVEFVYDGPERCQSEIADDLSSAPVCNVASTCGNGVIELLEECDDANFDATDGCAGCRMQPGFYCTSIPLGGQQVGNSTCQPMVCGDGLRHGNEACDDSNTLEFDGCSESCVVGTGGGNAVHPHRSHMGHPQHWFHRSQKNSPGTMLTVFHST